MADNSETRQISVGAPISVELPGYGTSGYRWYAVWPPSLRVERRIVPPPDDGEQIGRSALEIYDIVATEPGEATVTFELRMPRDDEAVERRTLTLVSG